MKDTFIIMIIKKNLAGCNNSVIIQRVNYRGKSDEIPEVKNPGNLATVDAKTIL